MNTALIGIALILGAPGTKDPPKKDAPSLVGEWSPTSALRGGKPDLPPPGTSITFTADGKVLLKEGKRDKAEDGTYTIDAKKDPAEIDIVPSKGEEGKVIGIYKFDKDSLILCIAMGKDRPAEIRVTGRLGVDANYLAAREERVIRTVSIPTTQPVLQTSNFFACRAVFFSLSPGFAGERVGVRGKRLADMNRWFLTGERLPPHPGPLPRSGGEGVGVAAQPRWVYPGVIMFASALLASVLSLSAPAPKDGAFDPAKLEGDWIAEKYVLGGQEDARSKGKVFRLAEGKFIRVGSREQLDYKLDTKSDPWRIDLATGKEEIAGIFKLDGDTLTICFPKGGKAERPTKFESPADTQIVLMILKREKKK